MPNPFASQAPLSPQVGGASQKRNPFASSAPLASGAGGAPTSVGPPQTQPRWGHDASAATPAAPPVPPSPTYGQQPHQFAPPPTATGMYPTPPEMHPQGAPAGPAGYGTPWSQPDHHPVGDRGWSAGDGPGVGGVAPVGAPPPSAHAPATSTPSLFVPAPQPSAGFPRSAGGPTPPAPTLFVPPRDAGAGAPPTTAPSPASAPPIVAPSPVAHPPPSGAPPISLRGRERYCSGGAWVGPAPEWPRPPADATLENADVSRVRQRHARIPVRVREKHAALMAVAVGARRKELEGISTKLGGMLVFLNEGEGETHLSDPVADSLAALCDAMGAGDHATVNAHLLYISTHHWEEAAYWFPALKRLVKL